MAISKILYIGDCGRGYAGKHLRQAIDYILEPEKTGQGQWIGGINCQPYKAYEQMKQTKKQFSKMDKRQGYHLILSFVEGEVDQETAFKIAKKFVEEYLGGSYEAVYAIHDNTDHIHGHIIFNSVNFIDGRKFRYEKGDWAKFIQPLTNRLCQEYGLSTINIEAGHREMRRPYTEWNDSKNGAFIWSDMIKRDLDACILQAQTFENFTELLTQKGYEIKRGKYLAIRPPGMGAFKRCKTLGEAYTEERICERIKERSKTQPGNRLEGGRIVRCRVKYYKRAGLSGIQKKYFSRLYRIGQLKKRPYSQAWKYKDEIRKMHQLEEEYLLLTRHNIHSLNDIRALQIELSENEKIVSRKKRLIYNERSHFKNLFELVQDMEALEPAEHAYEAGDVFFMEEHKKWTRLLMELNNQGYSVEEIGFLKEQFKSRLSAIRGEEKAIRKEKRIAGVLLEAVGTERIREEVHNQEIRSKKEERKR